MAHGQCKLTREHGKFVDSHLIPKALMKPDAPGHSFIEAGRGTRPIRRHSSWYDNKLVIRSGEDILEKLDDWAIKKLRQHKLVWSGWGPMLKLGDNRLVPGSDWGVRQLDDDEWPRLRLFFLSLLWRAAASDRREFDEINISADDVEKLRVMILAGDPTPLEFYPMSLTQLSTQGIIHNQTPFPDEKVIPGADENHPEHTVPFFRFYFDGLISHIDRRPIEQIQKADLGDLHLGNSRRIVISTIPYETSFQKDNIEAIMMQAASWSGRK